MPSQKPKVKKKKSDKVLKKELDDIFSKYIRLLYSDKNGNTKCVTCGILLPWIQIQNGHYESRQYLSLRFDEQNCHPQCVGCNIFKRGNYTEYARFMIAKYGQDHLDHLSRVKHTITKYFPYQDRIDYYKENVTILLNRLQNY